MKNIIFIGSILLSLTACSSVQNKEATTSSLGMANPASQYCVEQGGKLEIVKEANGEVGYCHLTNGQTVEEWAFFRQSQKECVAEQAKTLIGQKDLSEAEIKKLTQASVVRKVFPNQPVTMDYLVERVTVTVDPATKKIVQASCG